MMDPMISGSMTVDLRPVISLERIEIGRIIHPPTGWLLLESAIFHFAGAPPKIGDSITAVATVSIELAVENKVPKDLLVEMVVQATSLRLLYQTEHIDRLSFEEGNIVPSLEIRPDTWYHVAVTINDVSPNSIGASGQVSLTSIDSDRQAEKVAVVSVSGTYTTKS